MPTPKFSQKTSKIGNQISPNFLLTTLANTNMKRIARKPSEALTSLKRQSLNRGQVNSIYSEVMNRKDRKGANQKSPIESMLRMKFGEKEGRSSTGCIRDGIKSCKTLDNIEKIR